MTSHALAAIINRCVTREELRSELDRPITEAEREEVESLRRWFLRRYPTAEERLAYVRRAHAQWTEARRRASA